MKKLSLACLSAAFLLQGGCAVVTSPSPALINKAKWDGNVANNGVATSKTGEACFTNVLGILARGDASIEAAKKAGGITKVATVDHRADNILFLYGKYCTVVTGE